MPSLSLRRSLVVATAHRMASFIINLAMVVIVSRVLTPAQIGVFSASMAVIAFGHMIRDFGIGGYIIQEKELTKEKLSAAFTLALCVSWGIAAILVLGRAPLSRFYHDREVSTVLLILSANFILLPFATPVMSLFSREMRFVAIMLSDLLGSTARAGVSVALAISGYGVASLAWGSLTGTAAMTIAVLILRPERGIYSINLEHIKHVFRFGSTVFGSNVIRTIATDSSPIIIGRMLGLASAGFYSRAEGLVNIVGTYLVQGIKEVALPAFAHEHRTGSNLALLYLQRQQMLTGIAWPVLAFLAIEANPLIMVFYGQQWQASVAPTRYICLANAFSMILPIADATLFAMGRVGTILRLVTLRTVMVVAAFVIGGFYDLDRLAAFQIMPAVVGAALYSIAVARASALDQRKMFRTFLPSLLVSAGVTAVLLASNSVVWSLQIGLFTSLSLCAATGTGGYVLLLWLSRHPLWDELLRLREIRSWLT